MTIAFIAHPIAGDVKNNMNKIASIARQINLTEPGVVPFAPYVLDCMALDDNTPEERARGIKNTAALFEKGFIDELRLYGDRISPGMQAEIELAVEHGIKVRPMGVDMLNKFLSL